MKTYLIFILLIFFSVSSYSKQLEHSVLMAVPIDSIDRDLSVVTADSELSLVLDAKITHEAAKGSDANLEAIFQIEYELMAIASSDRQLYLMSRLNELKQHLLAKVEDGKAIDIGQTMTGRSQWIPTDSICEKARETDLN
jgi:hypothetical protein